MSNMSLVQHPWDKLGPPQPLDLDEEETTWSCGDIDGINHSPEHNDRDKCAYALKEEADWHYADAESAQEDAYASEDEARKLDSLATKVKYPEASRLSIMSGQGRLFSHSELIRE